MKSLLVSLGTGDDTKGAHAARALTAVICGTPALQENLLVAGGAPILVKQLGAPPGETRAACLSSTALALVSRH